MKALQILEATGGGARKHVRQLVCGLRSRGLEVDVIVSPNRAEADFGDDLEMFRGRGCEVWPQQRLRRGELLRDADVLGGRAAVLGERAERPQQL